MSYKRTYCEDRNISHNDVSCEVLVRCNHIFFLKSFGLPLICGICAEGAIEYAAVSLGNCCCLFVQQHFVFSKTFILRI